MSTSLVFDIFAQFQQSTTLTPITDVTANVNSGWQPKIDGSSKRFLTVPNGVGTTGTINGGSFTLQDGAGGEYSLLYTYNNPNGFNFEDLLILLPIISSVNNSSTIPDMLLTDISGNSARVFGTNEFGRITFNTRLFPRHIQINNIASMKISGIIFFNNLMGNRTYGPITSSIIPSGQGGIDNGQNTCGY